MARNTHTGFQSNRFKNSNQFNFFEHNNERRQQPSQSFLNEKCAPEAVLEEPELVRSVSYHALERAPQDSPAIWVPRPRAESRSEPDILFRKDPETRRIHYSVEDSEKSGFVDVACKSHHRAYNYLWKALSQELRVRMKCIEVKGFDFRYTHARKTALKMESIPDDILVRIHDREY